MRPIRDPIDKEMEQEDRGMQRSSQNILQRDDTTSLCICGGILSPIATVAAVRVGDGLIASDLEAYTARSVTIVVTASSQDAMKPAGFGLKAVAARNGGGYDSVRPSRSAVMGACDVVPGDPEEPPKRVLGLCQPDCVSIGAKS